MVVGAPPGRFRLRHGEDDDIPARRREAEPERGGPGLRLDPGICLPSRPGPPGASELRGARLQC
ncbi:hypothetical protein D187_004508 [Cystobacter fuscus DSM 2262]|uniref:Uncharacterized protein n=1 Tax=Cystobacter fuscus (strain ATCC 25194 / DSM 2262 / NBRC 100088 / M29) TaxID=1242864 RepID=S9Q9F2_CYSF2|nr:hypothetical protein D187_004508 [Cystobacter fuscus DSM 2262]